MFNRIQNRHRFRDEWILVVIGKIHQLLISTTTKISTTTTTEIIAHIAQTISTLINSK